MYLKDILRICLLAIASRYPEHSIDLDETVLEVQVIEAKGWRAEEIIEFLEAVNPQLLQFPAYLLIDESQCSISLINRSGERPTFYIHCRGKIPPQRSHNW